MKITMSRITTIVYCNECGERFFMNGGGSCHKDGTHTCMRCSSKNFNEQLKFLAREHCLDRIKSQPFFT